MRRSKAFLVPVRVEDTIETEAGVPDSFWAEQWTRLPEADATAAFVERVLRLLCRTMLIIPHMPDGRPAQDPRDAGAEGPGTSPAMSACKTSFKRSPPRFIR